MTTEKFKLFKAIYNILDSIWKDNQQEDLAIYLSEADPTLWENESADPAVFSEFCQIYDNCNDKNMSNYDFSIYYLEHFDPYYGDIKKYFTQIPRDECEAKLTELLK